MPYTSNRYEKASGDEVSVAIRESLKSRGYDYCFPLGKGATARVYAVRDLSDGRLYACKCSAHSLWLAEEGKLLQSVAHPLFPAFRDFWCQRVSAMPDTTASAMANVMALATTNAIVDATADATANATVDDTANGMAAGAMASVTVNATAFLVMEYVPGSSLLEHLKRRGTFSEQAAVEIALALAEGLSRLHHRKPPVAYRDLKPANIMLEPGGRVRLLDLGAASMQKGWKAGTYGYAAPEQLGRTSAQNFLQTPSTPLQSSQASVLPWQGAFSPISCDIYALGMLLHQLITGRDPVRDPEPPYPLRRYDKRISRGLEDIVKRCTADTPGERLQDMQTLIRALTPYAHAGGARKRILNIGFLFTPGKGTRIVYEKNIYQTYQAECRPSSGEKSADSFTGQEEI